MNYAILKVLVGSRAHGLASEQSDWDYRGVFVAPTRDLLSLGAKPQQTVWIEADKSLAVIEGHKDAHDNTAWELGHFLNLAVHCNPSILEVFAAPVVETDCQVPGGESFGLALRALFPCVWHPKGVRDAFVGYGLNQRKKFLDGKDGRGAKYACAYLRTLFQAWWLLAVGVLPIDLRPLAARDEVARDVYETLQRWRRGEYTRGEVVDRCCDWQGWVERSAEACEHRQDLGPVNEFLLDVRRRCW